MRSLRLFIFAIIGTALAFDQKAAGSHNELHSNDQDNFGPQYNPTYGEEDIAQEVEDGGMGGKEGSVIEQWEKVMSDFIPESMLTIPIAARTHETFEIDVKIPNEYIRGGFFVTGNKKSSIELTIVDPQNNKIFEKKDKEGLFHFHADKIGSYSFILSNNKWVSAKTVTFAVGRGNFTSLKSDHLDPVNQKIQELDKVVKDVQADSSYLWIRQRSMLKSIEGNQTTVWVCSFIQLLVICGLAGFQVYYIKNLVNKRGYQTMF